MSFAIHKHAQVMFILKRTHKHKILYLKTCFPFSIEKFIFQSQIPVNLQLEISPQHHDIVKGRNNMHVLSIMEQTKTKVRKMNEKPRLL